MAAHTRAAAAAVAAWHRAAPAGAAADRRPQRLAEAAGAPCRCAPCNLRRLPARPRLFGFRDQCWHQRAALLLGPGGPVEPGRGRGGAGRLAPGTLPARRRACGVQGAGGASRPGLRRDRLMVRVSAGSGAQASAPAGAWPAWSRACRRWPRARRRPHRTPPPRPPRARGWTPAAPSCATRWPGCRRGGAPPAVWPQPVPAWQPAPVEALRLAWLCKPLGWKGLP